MSTNRNISNNNNSSSITQQKLTIVATKQDKKRNQQLKLESPAICCRRQHHQANGYHIHVFTNIFSCLTCLEYFLKCCTYMYEHSYRGKMFSSIFPFAHYPCLSARTPYHRTQIRFFCSHITMLQNKCFHENK